MAATLPCHFYCFLGITRTTVFVDLVTHPSVFFEGGCKFR